MCCITTECSTAVYQHWYHELAVFESAAKHFASVSFRLLTTSWQSSHSSLLVGLIYASLVAFRLPWRTSHLPAAFPHSDIHSSITVQAVICFYCFTGSCSPDWAGTEQTSAKLPHDTNSEHLCKTSKSHASRNLPKEDYLYSEQGSGWRETLSLSSPPICHRTKFCGPL